MISIMFEKFKQHNNIIVEYLTNHKICNITHTVIPKIVSKSVL